MPVNGTGADGKASLGCLNFIFEEPIIAAAFDLNDFKFAYTTVNGVSKELVAKSISVTSFNPTGTSTGSSYYALSVFLADGTSTLPEEDTPEYNWQNCLAYYKGIYIGRVTLTWYTDPYE